jgi:hypothetical protein
MSREEVVAMSMPAVVEFDEYDLPLGWTRIPPGPELAIRLNAAEWSAMTDRELVAAMDAARRQATWAQALLLETVAELAHRRHEADPYGGSDAYRRICGEVSLELTVPTGQAEELVAMAETLPASLPQTWTAMRTGETDYDRARVMVDGVIGLDKALARHLDAELVGDVVTTTKTLLRRRLNRAIKMADPEAHAQRTKTARQERRVELWDNEDETCDLVGRNLDAVDAHAIRNRLTAAAQAMRADGDARPIDQIRLDLYRDLLRGIPLPQAIQRLIIDDPQPAEHADRTSGRGPTRQNTAAEVIAAAKRQIAQALAETPNPGQAHDPWRAGDSGPARQSAGAEVIAAVEKQIAQALAEIADEQLTGLLDRAQAEDRLDGLPRLIGQAARTMREALRPIVNSWCRVTGSDDHGHRGYRPPVAMQRLIQGRHSTCVYPTCHRRSVHCDLDHTEPYGKGGHTCKCNMAPLCRAHHRIFKQHPHWQLIQPWPGLLIWVAPAGTWHIVVPQ